MNPIVLVGTVLSLADELLTLVLKIAAIAKQQANMTPAQEAAFQARVTALKTKWASQLSPDAPTYPYDS